MPLLPLLLENMNHLLDLLLDDLLLYGLVLLLDQQNRQKPTAEALSHLYTL